jgi:hypothetical protein
LTQIVFFVLVCRLTQIVLLVGRNLRKEEGKRAATGLGFGDSLRCFAIAFVENGMEWNCEAGKKIIGAVQHITEWVAE